MNNVKIIAATLLWLCALSVSLAQITKTDSGYLFRMKFVKGASSKYWMSVDSQENGKSHKGKAPVTINVKSVDRSGTGTLDLIIARGTGVFAGLEKNAIETYRVTQRGQELRSNEEPAPLGDTSVVFPEHTIRPGGTWQETTKVDKSPLAGSVDKKYTFVGLKSFRGRKVAHVTVTVSGTLGSLNARGSGEMYLYLSDGSVHSFRFSFSTKGTAGGQKIDITSKITLHPRS